MDSNNLNTINSDQASQGSHLPIKEKDISPTAETEGKKKSAFWKILLCVIFAVISFPLIGTGIVFIVAYGINPAFIVTLVAVILFIAFSLKSYFDNSQNENEANRKNLRRLLIYSIIFVVSTGMAAYLLYMMVRMIVSLAGCKGSSCSGAIGVHFLIPSVIYFIAVSIAFGGKITELNKTIKSKSIV